MIHNNKVYANADEKFVKATIVYGASDKFFYDKEMEYPVAKKDVVDLCMAGVVIHDLPNADYRIPVTWYPDGSMVVALGGTNASPKVYDKFTDPVEE